MEGRRVSNRASKRNPLYIMFLCLIAAVFVLLIIVIVLGAKLGAAQKALDAAETQIEALQESAKQQIQNTVVDPSPAPADNTDIPNTDKPAEGSATMPDADTTSDTKKVTVDWLDLTGHSEVTVLPEKLFSGYTTYYTTAGVNMRGGPSTSHKKIMLVNERTAVKAAAKDGDWVFVTVNNKFGWIRGDYLSTTMPKAEATSGSLKQ